MNEESEIERIDWRRLKKPYDPMPWGKLDEEKRNAIIVVQLAAEIQAKKVEIEELQGILKILSK